MNQLNKFLSYLTLFFIFSCSSTKKTNNLKHYDFNSKNATETLAVPPDLTGLKTKNKYTIPKGSIRASEIKNNNNNEILTTYDNIYIENQGSQKWLVIKSNDTKNIWNNLKDFWLDMGFSIDKEEPQIGFMETKWAENRTSIPQDPIRRLFEKVGLGIIYSSSIMDKFIIRLENDKNGYSKITFSHKGKEEVLTGRNKESSKWQSRPRDPNIEAQYLARFMLFLGADENQINKTLEKSNNKSILAEIKDNNLILYGDLNRNKHRLEEALKRIGFKINNFDNNIFHITLITDNEIIHNKKKLKIFSKKQKKNTTNEYHPNILVQITPNNKNDNVNVTILNENGEIFRESKEIIKELYQELN